MKVGICGLGKLLCFQDGVVSIYGLTDPTSGLIRYVGKTIFSPAKRLQNHIEEALRLRKTRVHRWLVKLLGKGLKPSIRLLQIVPGEDWEEAERSWISHFREMGDNLTNHSDGGDGVPGHRHDEDTRKRIREARARQVVRHSPETRAKMSRVAKGKSKSEEHRKNLSKALTGKPGPMLGRRHSLETRDRLREAATKQHSDGRGPDYSKRKGMRSPMKGKSHTEEARRKISEAAKKQHIEGRAPDYSDPVRNKKISDALRGRKRGPQSPELRALRSEQMKKWWSSRRNSQCL